MPVDVRYVPVDADISNYSSVIIGRQTSRASVIGALSLTVLSPALAPLAVASLPSTTADASPPLLFIAIGAMLLYAFGLILAIWAYRLLYRGSRRLLTFTKWTTRISTPIILVGLIVPILMLLRIAADPLIIIYALALTFSIVVQIWFLRWTKDYSTAWRKAYQESSIGYQYLSPHKGRTFSFMMREMLALPPGWLVDKKKLAKVAGLMIIALILEGFAVSFVLQEFQSVSTAFRYDIPRLDELTDRSVDSRLDIFTTSISVIVSPFLSLPLLALSSRIRRAARRAAVHSMSEVRHKDTRAPFLFLRSFVDDQVDLTHREGSRNIFQRTLTGGSLFANVDELLTERYWHIGPVIAIGKPGEALPPLGAARAYLSGEPWQMVVANLMGLARAIIIVLDYTQGVTWELQQATRSGCLSKSLLLIPPHRHGDETLIQHTLSILGYTGDYTPPTAGPVVAIIPTSSGELVACCSNEADSYVYDFILRVGFHALLENRAQLLEPSSLRSEQADRGLAPAKSGSHQPAQLVGNAPSETHATRRSRGPAVAAVVGISAALILASAVAVAIAQRPSAVSHTTTPSRPTGQLPATPHLAPTTPTTIVSPTTSLQQVANSDIALAESVVDSWVPQISSKKTGLVVDGVTYNDALILLDFTYSQAAHSDAILVRSDDYSSFRYSGYWVTLIAEPYSTASAANAWCDGQGYAVNDCFAKRLSHTDGPDGNTVLRS